MNWLRNNFEIVLAAYVVTLSFALIYACFMLKIDEENKPIIYLAVGGLLTNIGTVINYYFGSSKGSKQKSDTMAKMMNGNNNNNEEGK